VETNCAAIVAKLWGFEMDYTQQRAFAEEIYQAAINIGLSDVQARVAAAQASQETQYGRHVAGNNYFGIKAGNSWDGPSQSVGTWEEINGRRVNIRDDFRVYETPEESLRDWASIMERNFPDVMSATTFDDAVQGLNNGRLGRYATDSDTRAILGGSSATFLMRWSLAH
jgi:flagellum-specific peptidoglycan hydrolase FlgJ